MPVFDTAVGTLGAVICWENYMPMLRMAMYSKGIQLYCAPTADQRDTWIATHAAHRLRGPLLRALGNQFARRSDYPDDYPVGVPDGPRSCAAAARSSCRRWASPRRAGDFDGEAILPADLDLDEIARGKYDFDVVGHYARPDIFRLEVNERQLD